MTPSPIPTLYKGYRFRSRLEARWAVFFARLGIAWQYEADAYQLRDGSNYLPDFYLPTFGFEGGLWAEVKPAGDAFCKARLFAYERPILLCEGDPAYCTLTVLLPAGEGRVQERQGLPNVDGVVNAMRWDPPYAAADGSIPLAHQRPHYQSAIAAALQMRFEPATRRRRRRTPPLTTGKRHR